MADAPATLSFDWGTTIVGILEIDAGIYTPYRSVARMTEAARLLFEWPGTIVSFNGNRRDLPEICALLGVLSLRDLKIFGRHEDMSEITSQIRWPPDPGTAPILGESLLATYRYYFGPKAPEPPSGLLDDYEASNWADCYMAAALWKRWQQGELRP